MSSVSKSRTTAVRRELRLLNKSGKSYRWIAIHKYGGKIKHGILQRLVKDGYIPTDETIIDLLGIRREKNLYWDVPPYYERSAETLEYIRDKRDRIQTMRIETQKALRKGRG